MIQITIKKLCNLSSHDIHKSYFMNNQLLWIIQWLIINQRLTEMIETKHTFINDNLQIH